MTDERASLIAAPRDGYGRCAQCGLTEDHTSTCRYRSMDFGWPKTKVSYRVETRQKGSKQWVFSHTPNRDSGTEARLLAWVADNPEHEARVTKVTETTEVAVVK